MIVSQPQPKCDEKLLATPIVSNRSVPEDVVLDSLHRFSLDSPASALTERSNGSNNSNGNGNNYHRKQRPPRFSCPNGEPIVFSRSRLKHLDRVFHGRRRGGLSRSKSSNEKDWKQNDDRRRPLALLSSIGTLITSYGRGKNEEDRQQRVCPSTTALLFDSKDILTCLARDFSVEILRRLSASAGAFFYLTHSTYNNIIHSNRPLTRSNISLSTSHELRLKWKRQQKRRDVSFRRRRERPICVSGLPNQGQTCFLNSVLQSLASLEPFLEYLESIVEYQEEREHVYSLSTLSQEASIAGAGGYGQLFFPNSVGNNHAERQNSLPSFSKDLLEILKEINCDGRGDEVDDKEGCETSTLRRMRQRRKRLDPKALLRKIAKTNPQFSSYGTNEQQDAQELFASLLGVVINDSQLDASSSDQRLEASRNYMGIHSEKGSKPNKELDDFRGRAFECNDEDELMTSAFIHSNYNRKSRMGRDYQIITKLGRTGQDDSDDSYETNILSLSDLLLRIEKERNKFLAESNICALSPDTQKKAI